MLDTKQKFPNPGSWAAFTLLGESRLRPVHAASPAMRRRSRKSGLDQVAFRFPVPANVHDLNQEPNMLFEDSVDTFALRRR